MEEQFGGKPHESIIVFVFFVIPGMFEKDLLEQLRVFEPFHSLESSIVGGVDA